MMVDRFLANRFEHEAITATMQLSDGSFLSGQDLQLLQDDYDHAPTELVRIGKPDAGRRGNPFKELADFPLSQAVSTLSYELKEQVRARPMPFILSGVAAVAAALLLALVVINPFASNTPGSIADVPDKQPPTLDDPAPSPTAVATLTGLQDATWWAGDFAVGDALLPGQRLALSEGTAQITTNQGAVVILQGPCTVEMLDHPNALRLDDGKLVGICETQSSKGLLVRTPHLDVTDLGTRFGVDVMPYRATEVHVHQGEVVVSQPNASAAASTQKQTITTNQAVKSDSTRTAITPIAPTFDKFHEALSVYRLRGTGYGLAEGAVDPGWQIVADANGPLDTPLRVIVKHSYKPPTYTHFYATGNDPSKAQWLFFAPGKPNNYYPLETPADLVPTRLVLEGRVQVPETLKLEGKSLYLRFAYNEGFNEIRLNDQAIGPLPKRGSIAGKILFHEMEIPVDQTKLKHGENTVRFDLPNNITRNLASFYLEWGGPAR